ncbi:hypothetical protein [Pseudorhodoferax sp.]|uniref:nSTAND1 domain-containing NTPase n=1 Tax=Pseudorhodoferax sp. TaxID=1993553 RepID=UPI0039E4049B
MAAAAAAHAPAGPALDDQRPWPGLAAYDEASQAWFKGREQEAAQLADLVQAHAVVALYGKSGLGKSSLLQAGAFPLLRAGGFLPVHARLDFSCSTSPWDQLLQLLLQAAAAAGLECPQPAPGEDLWCFLHRPDFELWTADNRLVTPVLVLDQFEEVFSRTAGQPAAVFDGLGDLLEHRIPSAIASDKAALAALDVLHCRYRCVLSFREDYLPDLRAWEPRLPSLLRQSMRLLPMTRAQAVQAVERAGHAVLAPGAAEAIVDFVASAPAGGEAVVEPVMLSLCCAQLNRRRAQGQRIDAELLRAAGPNIIEDFYEEAIAGMPGRVRHFIEDYLVQGRTRGSYARDEAIAQGFIDAAELERLTAQHRLLRVEPAGDVPRIELIHDRLVEVVRRAGDARRARQQADAAREREDQQRQRRIRRWTVAALCVVSVLAAAAGYFAVQAELSNARLDAALREAMRAKEAATEETNVAQQRLRQLQLLTRYGWAGKGDAWLYDNAATADALIGRLTRADSAPAAGPGSGGAELRNAPAAGGGEGRGAAARRAATVLEIWSKDVDQDRVRTALSQLGFEVRVRQGLLQQETNAVWFGTPVPVQDVQLVALALMRAGIQVKVIQPMPSQLPAHTQALVQVGAWADANGCQPYKADELMARTAFPPRGAAPCAR